MIDEIDEYLLQREANSNLHLYTSQFSKTQLILCRPDREKLSIPSDCEI